jgi:hypothetical protein
LAALAAIERFQWLGCGKLSQNQIRSLQLFPSTQCSSSGCGMESNPPQKREWIGRLGIIRQLAP